MKRIRAAWPFWACLSSAAAAATGVLPSSLSLSSDGGLLAFSWAGDLWVVKTEGGTAGRVTSHPAEEGRSAFSPDGRTLAFESWRDGARNLYVSELSGDFPAIAAGPVRRVTEMDRAQSLSSFSETGDALLFHAFLDPTVHRHARMYAAPISGGPVELLTEAFGMHPMPTGDGGYVFSRGRDTSNRPAYRGSASMDLFRMSADGRFERLTTHRASDFAGHPLPDGSIIFTSSRDGQNNLYKLGPNVSDDEPGAITQLTRFSPEEHVTIGHGVRDLAVAADGSVAAFVVWDTLYTLDLTRDEARPIAVRIHATADDDVPDREVIDVSAEASELAWHPSGEVVAVTARGEIWLRSTAEGRPTRRVTETYWRERDIAWSPDGKRLYFSADGEESLGSIYAATVALTRDDLAGATVAEDSEDEGTNGEADAAPAEPAAEDSGPADAEGDDGQLASEGAGPDGESADDAEPEKTPNPHGTRWANALSFEIEPVVVSDSWDRGPLPSPDGRSLLFVRGLGDLVHLELDGGAERVVLKGWDEPEVQWLPDARHIVYAREDLDFNSDIWLLDVNEGGHDNAVNLTRHPDFDAAPRVSADGKVLVFLSDRAGMNWDFDVHRVYLDRSLDEMTAYEIVAHFEDSAKAAAKREPSPDTADRGESPGEPLDLDAEDAWLRIQRITTMPESESDLAITPGGERIIFSGEVEGARRLFSIKHDGEDRKQLVTGDPSDIEVSLTGSAVAFIKDGRVAVVPAGGGDTTAYPIAAEVRISRRAEQRQKFLEGARTFGETFYNIKGLDWPRLIERYLPLVGNARTDREFNQLFDLLLGEVDGSHTGIWGGDSFSTTGPKTGYLGVDLEPAGNGYRVTRVLAQGPAAKEGEAGLRVGDLIVAIDGDPIVEGGALRDIRAAMTATVGSETLLEIRREGETAFVLLTPHGFNSERDLRYRDEIETRRAEVERLSDGRLGYLHIRGMNLPSVREFERDLYAAASGRDGLVIDVRDNGGGFTTDILLASLTAPRHAYTIPRGADRSEVSPDSYPRDRRLIYGWTRPINVIMNQHSFSNAEIFSHAIKTSGRGRLVGVTTFGGVISTGGFRLIDGTFIRRPFRGWYLPDGRDMDVHGAEPDVPVAQTPADEAAGRDPQLEAAVRDLLMQIDTGQDPRAIGP